MTTAEVNALPERARPPEPTHELCRWGQPYWLRGNRGGVIKGAEYTYKRPWWWLRLLGWNVRPIAAMGSEAEE